MLCSCASSENMEPVFCKSDDGAIRAEIPYSVCEELGGDVLIFEEGQVDADPKEMRELATYYKSEGLIDDLTTMMFHYDPAALKGAHKDSALESYIRWAYLNPHLMRANQMNLDVYNRRAKDSALRVEACLAENSARIANDVAQDFFKLVCKKLHAPKPIDMLGPEKKSYELRIADWRASQAAASCVLGHRALGKVRSPVMFKMDADRVLQSCPAL